MTEYVSSDTNIWIDFAAIDAVEMPFRLALTYIMWEDAVNDEVRSPEGLKAELIAAGLQRVKISTEEFYLADGYGGLYPALSVYDAVALAIAKTRGIVLLTGDMRLRKAAAKEGVAVMGTIGVLDKLLADGLASQDEYSEAIRKLLNANGDVVRLPSAELRARLIPFVKDATGAE